jgi:hypothetical protein
MARTYDVGASVRLTFDVYTGANLDVLTDATVALTVTKPDGSAAPTAVSHDSTGRYSGVVVVDQAGVWLYRWVATLALTLYVTPGELAEQLGDSGQAADPALLEARCRQASRAVDQLCRQRFWHDATPVARLFRPRSWTRLHLPPLSSSSGVVVETDASGLGSWGTQPAGSWQLLPLNAAAEGGAYRYNRLEALDFVFPANLTGRPTVRVTGRWGWSQVPDNVGQAALLLAARLWARKDTPLGLEGGFGEMGPVYIAKGDPDVARLLGRFTRTVVV